MKTTNETSLITISYIVEIIKKPTTSWQKMYWPVGKLVEVTNNELERGYVDRGYEKKLRLSLSGSSVRIIKKIISTHTVTNLTEIINYRENKC